MRRLRWLSLLLALLFLAGIVMPAWPSRTTVFKSRRKRLTSTSIAMAQSRWSILGSFPTIRVRHPIDYVDVGLPNSNYDLNSITASVNGTAISDIETTNNGITLGLGNLAIQSGSQGTVDMRVGTIIGMLYTAQAQNSVDYAGLQFSPNWFNSQYAHGTTNLIFTVFLPSGMTSTDPRYFNPQGWPGTSSDHLGV